LRYSKALECSKLPEAVQKNLYYGELSSNGTARNYHIDPTHWKAIMGLLVGIPKPEYQQRQTLKVTINFIWSLRQTQGVRGYSIANLQSIVTKAPCKCTVEENSTPDNAKP